MIFFSDLDGPILDVSEKYYRAYADSLLELGGDVLIKPDYWELKRQKTSDIDILAKTSSQGLLTDFKQKRNDLIEQKHLLDLDYVWRELKDVYRLLYNRNPVVLVTLRTNSDRTLWQLEKLGVKEWLSAVLFRPASINSNQRWQDKVELIKDIDLFKCHALEDCVFIGDTETDILAGKYLGMRTIAVSFGIRAKALLLPFNPDLIFDTPADLSVYLRQEYL